MKSLFGFLFFMLFLAGFAFVLLQGRQMAETNLGSGGAGITGIHWRPTQLAEEALPADSGMSLQLAVDGGVKGNAGCNSFFGSLQKTDSGIAFGPLGATKRACAESVMRREAAFLKALSKVARFEHRAGKLRLFDADGRLRVAFEAQVQD